MSDVTVNIDLPGWPQTADEPNRKEFQGDGYKFVLDTSGGTVDVAVVETPGLTLTNK